MPDLTKHDWLEVNHYMRDDYRLLVAAMAARQIPTAPPELQTLARTAFGSIPVRGARNFSKGDLVQQRLALAKAMPTVPQIASLVIALWSLAAQSQINLLKQAGETGGLEFAPDWDWRKGMEGFYDFESIPLLSALADGLGEHTDEKNADHLKLAALWLGPAVTNPDALANVPQELQPDHADDDEHAHDHDAEHTHAPETESQPTEPHPDQSS